jgi:hypothetical protein
LGQQPLDIGAQLGGRAATAGANSGQSLLMGGLSAARTQQAGQYNPMTAALMGLGSNPAFGQGVAKLFGGSSSELPYTPASLAPDFAAYYGRQSSFGPQNPFTL